MKTNVKCYSGSWYAERPTSLVWEGEDKRISKIIDRKLLPFGRFFLVITDDHCTFELTYEEDHDEWHIQYLGEEPA